MKRTSPLPWVALVSNAVATLALVALVQAYAAIVDGAAQREQRATEAGPVSIADLLEMHPVATFVLPLALLAAVAGTLAALIVGAVVLKTTRTGALRIYNLVWSAALLVALFGMVVL